MLRSQTDELNPADWFYFATDRLRNADIIWAAEGLTPSGIELLREAAEPFLKGYLVGKGWRLVKTDRKSTRLNSSHLVISYAVFCLKKKKLITRVHIIL